MRRLARWLALVVLLPAHAWADAPAEGGDDEPIPGSAPAAAPEPEAEPEAPPASDSALPPPAPAREPEPPRRPTPFDRGKLSLSFGLSSQRSFDARYFVIAAGLGYYVLPGLEPSFQVVHWFGSGPSVTEVSPALLYVVTAAPWSLKPYLGTFYTHWFVGSGIPDLDTVGGRVGLITATGGGLVLGLGLAYEHVLSDCVSECNSFYPDFIISLSL